MQIKMIRQGADKLLVEIDAEINSKIIGTLADMLCKFWDVADIRKAKNLTKVLYHRK